MQINVADAGERYVLNAVEDETYASIAKELEPGCKREDLVKLNEQNPACVGLDERRAKVGKKGNKVWLPMAASSAYLLNAKVAAAEGEAHARVAKAEAEAKDKVARAVREVEAAKAEAASARAEAAAAKAEAAAANEAAKEVSAANEAATSAAGSKHQARRPDPDEDALYEDAPDASAITDRLTALEAAIGSKQQELDEMAAKIDECAKISALASVVPHMETARKKLEDELAREGATKAALLQAQQDHESAAEEVQAAKRRRLSAQTALTAAWRHASHIE